MIKFIIIIILIFLQYKIWLVECQIPSNWIYSPQYSYILYSSGKQSGFSKIRVSSSTGIIFISSGDAGIIVIDPTKGYTSIAQQKSTENIQGFTSTDDAKYIYMSYNQRLTVFSFQNTLFTQVGQYPLSLYITDILINSTEDTIYVFQNNGNTLVFDISIKSQPNLIGNILWNSSEIYGGFITSDNKFLLLSQDILGLGVIALNKSSGSVTGTLVGYYKTSNSDYSNNVIVTSDNKYLINIDYRRGLSFADFSLITTANPSSYPIAFSYFLFQWWPSKVILPSPVSFCLSLDNNFLFLGVKAIGIYTVDITNINSPSVYSWSYFSFHANSVVLSPDTQFLYFSNSYSFMAFRKAVPSLGLKYVNMYNGQTSVGFNKAVTQFYWRCDIDLTRQVYLGAFDTDGLWLIDVSNPQIFNVIKSSYFPSGSNSPIDVFYSQNNYNIMVLPINDGTNFLVVLDMSDYNNIIEIQRIPLGRAFNGYVKDMDYTLDNKLLAAAIDRIVVFVDVSTLLSYSVKAIWQFLPSMKGFTTGITISYDGKYIIGACRGFGYYVLDIQDLTNIQIVNYQDSDGAEQVYKSLTYSYQYYLVDGMEGLYIMDSTQLPQFVPYSTLLVNGWTNDITFLENEDTVIISATQQGMIYLLDISDNKNPFIVSSYQYGIQNGLYTCAKQDFSNLYINNNLAVRSFPLSTQVYIHTDYIQIFGYSLSGEMLFNIIENPDTFIFQVGQTVKLNTDMLYQPLDMIVSNVFLCQKQIMTGLPSWIVYNPIEISITINITNNAIDILNQSEPLLNTIVFMTVRPLYESDFIFTTGGCQTSLAQATSIFSQFQTNGVIDQNNLVSPNLSYNDQQQISLTDTILFPNSSSADVTYNSCLSQLLKVTLMNSIQYTPIYLMINPSLKLVIDGSTTDYISTLGIQVSILLQIPIGSGIFIFNQQISVVISTNDERNIVNITGLVSNVNNCLSKKIMILPTAPQKYETILVAIEISDQINYPIQLNVTASKLPFIAQKQSIYLNPKYPLQSQFSDYIEIITQFSFSMNSETFIVPDLNTQITYTVTQQNSDGSYQAINENSWLQYSASSYLFYGSPPQNVLNTSIKIQVVGSDGFTQASDVFTVHVTKLPLTFLFQWIVTGVGIITGTLGMYKYRNIYYNMIFNKRNRYSVIVCKPKQPFILKIPLILYDQKAAIQIITNLEKELMRKVKSNSSFKNCKNQNSPEIKIQKFNKKDTKNISVEEIQQKIVEEINHKQHLLSLDITIVAQAYQKRLLTLSKSTRQSSLEANYLNPNGQINSQSLLKDIVDFDIKFNIKNIKTSSTQFKDQLKSTNTTFSQCLLFSLARKLICLDLRTFTVYSYLKFYSEQVDPQLTPNDSYKFYINLYENDELDLQGHVSPFPLLQLRFSRLIQALNTLNLIDKKQFNSFHSDEISDFIKNNILETISRDSQINLFLIEQVLYADSLGIKLTSPNPFFPCCGESIHIDPHDLQSIEAFKYSPGGLFFCARKALGLDYAAYGPKKNMQLPSWIQIEMQPGLILMRGIPEIQNVEEVLIRILTIQGYIIRHFILRVEEDVFALQQIRKEVESKQELSKRDGSNLISRQSKRLYGSSNIMNSNQPLLQFKLNGDPQEPVSHNFKMYHNSFQMESQQRKSIFQTSPTSRTPKQSYTNQIKNENVISNEDQQQQIIQLNKFDDDDSESSNSSNSKSSNPSQQNNQNTPEQGLQTQPQQDKIYSSNINSLIL